MTSLSIRRGGGVSLSDHVKRRRNNSNNVAPSHRGGSMSSGSGSGSSSSDTYYHNVHSTTYYGVHSYPNSSSSHSQDNDVMNHSPQHDKHNHNGGNRMREEGGYDSHVARYGNYDAPSSYCRSYLASEHGCYAAENHIVSSSRWANNTNPIAGSTPLPAPIQKRDGGNNNNHQSQDTSATPNTSRSWSRSSSSSHNSSRQLPLLARLQSYSDPFQDLEDQRYIYSNSSSRQQPRHHHPSISGGCPISSSMEGADNGGRVLRSPQEEEEEEARHSSQDRGMEGGPSASSSSYCSKDALTASTSSSSSSSSGSTRNHCSVYNRYPYKYPSHPSSSIPPIDEEAIRRGILDISTLVATYMAGALSFLIGIFLTLLSPFIKIIQCIVGDVRILLFGAGEGGAGTVIQEIGSLWRLCRELRSRYQRSYEDDPYSYDYDYTPHRVRRRRRPDCSYLPEEEEDDGTSLEDGSTTVDMETSSQFVGGWRPRVCPSVGSGGGASSVSTPHNYPSSAIESSCREGGGTLPYSSSPVPLNYQGGRRSANYGRVSHVSSNTNEEVMSCPPNVMGYSQRAFDSVLARPQYSTSGSKSCSSGDSHVRARRRTEVAAAHPSRDGVSHRSPCYSSGHHHHHHQPLSEARWYSYPRSKSDVVT